VTATTAARHSTPPQAAVAVFGPRRAEPRPSGRSSSSGSGGHVVSGTDKGFAHDDGHHGQIRSFRSPPRRHRVLRHGPLAGPATTSSRRTDVRVHAPTDARPGSLIAALDVVFSQVRWRCRESTNDIVFQRMAKDPGLDLALGHWSSQTDPRKATSVAAGHRPPGACSYEVGRPRPLRRRPSGVPEQEACTMRELKRPWNTQRHEGTGRETILGYHVWKKL
jgi:hypothetical protein